MATGPNWQAGTSQGLWHVNFKINTEVRGFNLKFHLAEKTEANAKAIGVDLGKRLLYLLPADASIFFATVSKDDHKKDSRFLRDCLGDGKYNVADPVVTPSVYDFSRTAVLIRLEHANGGSVTRKFCPIPDNLVTDGALITSIADQVDFAGALPALPTVITTWQANFATFLQALILQTSFVESGHAPGQPYTYFAWQSAFPLRIGDKKGGRVFI